MNKQKILYLDQECMYDPELFECVTQNSKFNQSEIENFLSLLKFNGGITASYARTGLNVLPVKTDLIDAMGWQVPEYDPTFATNFADITDQQCEKFKTKFDSKPWLVLWSGGIDSTLIVASILKNFSKAELSRVKIACNKISVYENPRFFFDHIKPNFELVNSTDIRFDRDLFNTHVVFDGEPADQLFASRLQKHAFLYPDSITKNIRTDPDQLLNFLSEGTFDTVKPLGSKWAQWFYEIMIDNIDSQSCPITTYHDFYWWYMFNLTWTGIKIRPLRFQNEQDPTSLKLYFDNFISWFDSVEYQQWAMNNNQFGIKYGNNIAEYKLVAKQYIYEYDHNEWYFKFKTKKNSLGQTYRKKSWNCLLDDSTRLNLQDHRRQILELLPDHIN
jgi:hypothetical protein